MGTVYEATLLVSVGISLLLAMRFPYYRRPLSVTVS
jgi:hypothetical protein